MSSDEKAIRQSLPKTRSATPGLRSGRLSVNPLSVLLPPMGEVSDLQKYSPLLQRRLAALQLESGDFDDKGSERNRLANEESMLNQVFQWLSVGSEDD